MPIDDIELVQTATATKDNASALSNENKAVISPEAFKSLRADRVINVFLYPRWRF